ncbi:hypothetical protein Tco_0891908 [Tanacetum coccineum]|uniref:Uncharacterized protein n=1 Tax=Tanacetum coccineum TaxID=301880 RepID=A0ABQ5C4M5_9ASTR
MGALKTKRVGGFLRFGGVEEEALGGIGVLGLGWNGGTLAISRQRRLMVTRLFWWYGDEDDDVMMGLIRQPALETESDLGGEGEVGWRSQWVC